MINLTKERGSGPPYGSNGLKSRTLFYERLNFKENVKHSNNYDMWYSNPYYGRVDHNATPVYLNESYLLPINTSEYVLNFVAKNFLALKDYVDTAARNTLINKKSILATLMVQKGWRSVLMAYYDLIHEHLRAFVDGHLASSVEKNAKVLGLKDFLSEFLLYSRVLASSYPVTRSAYLLSNKCSVLSTGLAIELSNFDHGDDSIKVLTYLQDSNFSFFEKAASKFGFAIDPNAPWRLIAKIGSTPMLTEMQKFNITFENVFDVCYHKSYMTDYYSFVTYISEMYKVFRQIQPEIKIPRVCIDSGKTYQQVLARRDENEFAVPYTEWLKAYLRIRSIEQGLTWTESVFMLRLSEILTLANNLGLTQALEYMEKVTGGLEPLAYSGARQEFFALKTE